jgi:hypothetical protein
MSDTLKEKTAEPTDVDKTKYLDGSVLFYLPGEVPEGQASETVCVLSNGVNTNSCPDGHGKLNLIRVYGSVN